MGISPVIRGNGRTSAKPSRGESMKRRMLALIVLMIAIPFTTALARNPRYARDWYEGGRDDRDSYAAIKLGVFTPNEDTSFLENGFVLGGVLGHKFSENFAFELGVENVSTCFDQDYTYEDVQVNSLGIPVTAKFIAPLSKQVELYAGAGFGVYFTSIEQYDHADAGYHDDGVDDTSLGFHALVGADLKMNPSTAFTMELKYTEIEQDFEDPYYDDLEIGGTTASMGLKFLF
jgi:opacity protein-like surface antigen